jgi:hypothetical protein
MTLSRPFGTLGKFFSNLLGDETLLATLELKEMGLGVQSSSETGELSRGADDTVTWHDDGDRIPAICSADSSCRAGISQLRRELAIGAGFTEGDTQEDLPDLLLKWCASHIERHGERVSLAREIFVQLGLGSKQDRVVRVFDYVIETHTPRIIVLPKDGNHALITGNEL